MTEEIQVGDLVTYRLDTKQFTEEARIIPENSTGKVVRINEGGAILVRWDHKDELGPSHNQSCIHKCARDRNNDPIIVGDRIQYKLHEKYQGIPTDIEDDTAGTVVKVYKDNSVKVKWDGSPLFNMHNSECLIKQSSTLYYANGRTSFDLKEASYIAEESARDNPDTEVILYKLVPIKSYKASTITTTVLNRKDL